MTQSIYIMKDPELVDLNFMEISIGTKRKTKILNIYRIDCLLCDKYPI